jgi:AraC family transcriptional regulator of adaptative response/methylated-DNA-[protein]-cysteine methyltransferase
MCRHPPDDGTISALVAGALQAIRTPETAPSARSMCIGTAFQEVVWRELRKIPPSETRSMPTLPARWAIRTPRVLSALRHGLTGRGAGALPPRDPPDGTLGGHAGGLDRRRNCWRWKRR